MKVVEPAERRIAALSVQVRTGAYEVDEDAVARAVLRRLEDRGGLDVLLADSARRVRRAA